MIKIHGDRVNPWDACNYVTEMFQAGHMTATEMKRGIVEIPMEAVNLLGGIFILFRTKMIAG